MFDSLFDVFGFKCQLSTDQYLTHYWPIHNGTMKDEIGSSHMTQGSLTSFTSDRFGNVNSALALNQGQTQVPSGIYFDSPEFSISFWVYPQSLGTCARAIDFGTTGSCSNTIYLRLDGSCGGFPALGIFPGITTVTRADSTQNLIQNKWQFLTGTFNGTLMSFYVDGTLSGTRPLSYTLPTIIRNANYIGKSCNTFFYSSSYLDDLRFYNKSLTQMEIQQIINQNFTCKNIFFKFRFYFF